MGLVCGGLEIAEGEEEGIVLMCGFWGKLPNFFLSFHKHLLCFSFFIQEIGCKIISRFLLKS